MEKEEERGQEKQQEENFNPNHNQFMMHMSKTFSQTRFCYFLCSFSVVSEVDKK